MAEKNQQNDTQPILVAVDFSSHSLAALKWAAEASQHFEAPIVVLHVVHDPGAAPGYYSEGRKDLRPLEDAAREMFESFLDDARKTHPGIARMNLESKLVVGLPANRILEVAEKVGAGLIVMGSQGRTGLSHFLLGSKAQRVVQLSSIPVTIVKAESAAPNHGQTP